jgi:hypothetical protein
MPTQEQDWLGVDGKSLKATVRNYDKAYQDFINVVSVLSTRCGVAIAKREERLHSPLALPQRRMVRKQQSADCAQTVSQ